MSKCILSSKVIEDRTLISYNIHPATMFRYTQSMILHPRTASNISENQHLDGDFGFVDGA
jgi:hypothetical protein